MVSPETALPALSGSGNESVWVSEMAGAKAAARKAARGAPVRGAPAPKAAGTRGVISERVMARESIDARRDFWGKAILKAFDVMNLSLRVGWIGFPLVPMAG